MDPVAKPMFRQALAEFVSGGRYEKLCLALAVYHEARGEPEAGQQAVAMVIRNRVRAPGYPPTICGVVFQNAHKKNRCQFSFACSERALAPLELDAWILALRVAGAGVLLHPCGDSSCASADREAIADATHYHADWAKPKWARSLKRLGRIGQHIFLIEESRRRGARFRP